MGDEPHGQLWVAFVCIPAFGHAKPLLNFAAQLLDAQSNYQYRVSFLTSASCIDYLKSKCDPRIELIGIEDGVIPEFKRMDLGKPKEVKKHVVLWLRDQMRPALNQYFEGVTETTGKQPDLFICDHLSHAGADCAASLGVPYVVHLAWPLFMLSVIGGYLRPHSQPKKKITTTSAQAPRRRRPRRPAGPPHEFFAAIRAAAQGAPVLCTAAWGVERPRPLPPSVRCEGGGVMIGTAWIRKVRQPSKTFWTLAFLEEHKEIVYVSFGSRIPPSEQQVQALRMGLVAAAAGRGTAVLWALKARCRPYLVAGAADGRLPARHLWVDWAPQAQVVAHPNVKVVVTHCGMGGFYECLQNAKPILAIPFLLSADQPVNAQTAVDGGYGLKLTPERYTAEEVETAIGQLLTDQTFEAAARRVQRAVLSSGYGDQGPKMVESLILHGAGHLFPPAAAPGSGA
ncbi:unnamed protein product, partial [Heterosigma akashiwo]